MKRIVFGLTVGSSFGNGHATSGHRAERPERTVAAVAGHPAALAPVTPSSGPAEKRLRPVVEEAR